MEKIKVNQKIYPPEKERANRETIWEHYFARKVAFLIAPFFLKAKISPNQISILAIFFGFIAAILIMLGNSWVILFGAILFQVWLILDKLDGVIARYRKSITRFGEFLEEFGGEAIAILFFSSVGVAASKFPGNLFFLKNLPSHLFIIFGISTSLFIIFRHLMFGYFKIIFLRGEKTENQLPFSKNNFFYKIGVKFLGIYSLAQPILILAIIFNFLGIYVVFYFIFHALVAIFSTISLMNRAKRL